MWCLVRGLLRMAASSEGESDLEASPDALVAVGEVVAGVEVRELEEEGEVVAELVGECGGEEETEVVAGVGAEVAAVLVGEVLGCGEGEPDRLDGVDGGLKLEGLEVGPVAVDHDGDEFLAPERALGVEGLPALVAV